MDKHIGGIETKEIFEYHKKDPIRSDWSHSRDEIVKFLQSMFYNMDKFDTEHT